MHLKRATTTGTPKGSPNHSKANYWVATQTASPEKEQSPNHSLVNDWVGTQDLTVNYWVATFYTFGHTQKCQHRKCKKLKSTFHELPNRGQKNRKNRSHPIIDRGMIGSTTKSTQSFPVQ